MNAKQTPLVDILRLHAEDLHSDYGHNKSARLLSQAADEIECLRVELAACQQDAERYRWLRDNGDGFEITVREVNEDGGEEWIAGYSGPELDIAIDTARKGEGE